MTSLKDREKRNKFCVNGFTRMQCKSFEIEIPDDIIQLIFIFYHIIIFDYQHPNHIGVKKNTIKNETGSCLHTIAIGDTMDPQQNKVYKMTIKIERKTGYIGIGIIESKDLNVTKAFINVRGSYSYFNTGMVYNAGMVLNIGKKIDEYVKDDMITLILNTSKMSLLYEKIGKDGEQQSGVVVKSGGIKKVKYKWATAIYNKLDSLTVIDIQ